MRSITRWSLCLVAILVASGLDARSANAGSATFSSAITGVTAKGAPTNMYGTAIFTNLGSLTVTETGLGDFPNPDIDQNPPNAVVTLRHPASMLFSNITADSLTLNFNDGTIAGSAGPGSGTASATATGTSPTITFSNMGANPVNVTVNFDFYADLVTSVTGSGIAMASYKVSLDTVSKQNIYNSTKMISQDGSYQQEIQGQRTVKVPAAVNGAAGTTAVVLTETVFGLASTSTPEPCSFTLLAIGVLGLIGYVRCHRGRATSTATP
jgi:hypothetical protein